MSAILAHDGERPASSELIERATPVSTHSTFGDGIWDLDIDLAGFRPDQKKINWHVQLEDGSRLTDPQHEHLLTGAKQFLWSLAIAPPFGRKRASPSTLASKGKMLRFLVRWMVSQGRTQFASLTPEDVQQFQTALRVRRTGRGGAAMSPLTIQGYLLLIKDIYRQRDSLADALHFDPFPNDTVPIVAGVTRSAKRSIPFIPEPIAVDLLNKALIWVEQEADGILEQRDLYSDVFVAKGGEGKSRRRSSSKALSAIRGRLNQPDPPSPAGRVIDTKYVIDRCWRHLVTACFIVIAGFVGMRVSEILSMRTGAIKRQTVGETGAVQLYIVARLYKTSDQTGGRLETWIAPPTVARAVHVLERASASLRRAAGRDELFLVPSSRRQVGVSAVTTMQMDARVNEFAAYVNVPLDSGRPWHFSTHQFRKTFARFVARRDRSQLLGLAEHFKHASVAMTAKGYVGTDFDLHELVDHEAQVDTAKALDRFLCSDQLAGRMGERIASRNAMFRGRAGEQVRRDYVSFVLKETDLRIHACEYGWCVFQQELSRCGGTVAPNEVERSPAVCLDCSNFVVEPKHAPYWQDRKQRNARIYDAASALTRAALDESITQCDRVLSRIGEGQSVKET